MPKIGAALFLLLVATVPALAAASRTRSYSSRSTSHRSSYSHHRSYSTHPHRAGGVARDRHGRIRRSPEARRAFERQQPCPSTGKRSGRCPGYVIDHVNPLECGGADDPSNMQWQTTAAAKAKDRTEGACRIR